MAKTLAGRVVLATRGAAVAPSLFGRWRRCLAETEIIGHRPFARVSVRRQRFRSVRFALYLPGLPVSFLAFVFVAPQRAAAVRCDDGSSLAAQIDLAGMEADVSGSKTLSRMLGQVGTQL